MKTVSEAVVSSKSVSLSKAAKILSKFSSADNGASLSSVAYLKLASDSFDELVLIHKELRGSGSERRNKKHRSGSHDVEELLSSVRIYVEHRRRENGFATRKKDLNKRARMNGKYKEERSTQGTSKLEAIDNCVESVKKNELEKNKKVVNEEGSNVAVETVKEPTANVVNGEQFENDIKSEVFEKKKTQIVNKETEVEERENKAGDLGDQRYTGYGDSDVFGTDNTGEKKKGKTRHIHVGEGRKSESKAENQNEKKGSKKRKSGDS